MNKLQIDYNTATHLNDKVDLYINIFGEEPWNEGYIDEEGNLYPLSYKGDISKMKKVYNPAQLKKERNTWSEKKGYIEALASILDDTKEAPELVGFIMGWSDSLSVLNQEKFDLNESQFIQLKEQIQGVLGKENMPEDFFYAADLGVKPNYRGQHIASKLYDARHKKIIENGEKVIIVRTTKNRPVPYQWYVNKGFQEVFSYDDQQNRVILILPVQENQQNARSENTDQ